MQINNNKINYSNTRSQLKAIIGEIRLLKKLKFDIEIKKKQ